MHLGVSVAYYVYIGCIEFEGASMYGVVDAQAINVLQMVKVCPGVGDADISGTIDGEGSIWYQQFCCRCQLF